MKNRIATAVATLLVASLGTAAYAQGAQQTTPPQPATPTTTSGSTANGWQSNQDNMSHRNGNMSGSMSSDQIAQKVKHELSSNGVTATGVDVTFNDGTATLSGTVYNQRDIAKAKQLAMRVHGVKHVDASGLHARQNGTGQGKG